MTATITIKDYPCGSGKTTSMIQSFRENEKYLVILPELSEIDRVILETNHVTFVAPTTEDNILGTKSQSLKELLLLGQNIATTHAMYERLVPLAEEGLLDEYCIFIDEVPEVVKAVVNKSKTSVEEIYINGGYVEVEDTGLVSPTDKWQQNKKELSDTLDSKILKSAQTGCLYLLSGKLFIWALPSLLLGAGKSVTILTYKAEGSLLVSYLQKLSAPFVIEKDAFKEQAFREKALALIDLKDIPAIYGKKNKLNLTHTGQSDGMKNKSYCSKMVTGLKNLRGRQLKGMELSDVILTCKKDAWIQDNGKAGVFAKGSKMFGVNWISNKTRGTNKYAHCSTAIYLYNQHINPLVGQWINDSSRQFDDAYALTELIQWVWRTRVRKGKPITLYLPAPRMRGIFINWLEGWDSKGFGEMSLAA